ncbi:MAG: hypothetical protein II794_03405 [Oscillospiraceae bacterium]|nr:hypothetical protein [Oscillospiraceae bacterium]
MRRNFSIILALLLCAAMLCGVLAGCGPANQPQGGENEDPKGQQTDPKPDDTPKTPKVTVSWYDGTKLLKEEQVEKGSKLTSWTPEKADSTFMAWYAEASKTQLFDFNTAVNEDTDLFAGFKGALVPDTTTWCLIGSGAGTLKGSNWSEAAETEENFKLTKTADKDKNLFVMENVTLYEGDAFQIRVKGTWTGQHGVGYLEGYTALAQADGDVVGEVKVGGERWFFANGGFGDSPKGWNINVAKSGIYTIRMETNPGSNDYDIIHMERTGDAPELTMTHDMYLKGTMNDWSASEAYQMTTDALREEFTFTITVTDEMLADWTATDENNPYKTKTAALKVANEISGSWYGVSETTADAETWTLTAAGGNNLFLKPGQYKITYNVATDSAAVVTCQPGYFLAGVVDGADHWDCTAVDHQFQKVDDTTYTLIYTFTEADTASWIKDAGKKGAVKGVYGFSNSSADLWFGQKGDGENLMIDSYGTYRITLHLTGEGEGYIEAQKITGNFLVGTLPSGEDWASSFSTPMGGDTFEITFAQKAPASWLGADEIAAIKVVTVGEDGSVTWFGTADGGNVMLTRTGKYTVTLKNGVVTATRTGDA